MYIKSLFVQITKDCNYNCSYCLFSKDNINFKRYDNFNKQKKALRDILNSEYFTKNSFKNLIIYGGEPLLYIENTKKIINFYFKKKINGQISICTNGILLNEKIIKYFSKYKNISFSINLDGDYKTVSLLKLIEKKKFNKILKNFKLFNKYKIPFYFSTTITPFFLLNFKKQIKFLLQLNPEMIGFNIVKDEYGQKKLNINNVEKYFEKSLIFLYNFKSNKNFHYINKKKCIENNIQKPDCICSGSGITINSEGFYNTCELFNLNKYKSINQIINKIKENKVKLFLNKNIPKQIIKLPTFGGGCIKLNNKINNIFVKKSSLISYKIIKNEKI